MENCMALFDTLCSRFFWQDSIEILFFSVVIYSFIKWLNRDHDKKLLASFYVYSLLIGISYYAQLTTISLALLVGAPLLLLFYLIMHQEKLQKNYIAYKTIKTAKKSSDHWVDELLRVCLLALNKNKEIICVIERTDALEQFLKTSCIFNADLKTGLLDLLLQGTVDTNAPTMIWVSDQGQLRAFDVMPTISVDRDWLTPDFALLPQWQQEALFLSTKTDAIIIAISSFKRVFSLIINDTKVEELTAAQACALLKRYVYIQKESGDSYYGNSDTYAAKNSREQQLS